MATFAHIVVGYLEPEMGFKPTIIRCIIMVTDYCGVDIDSYSHGIVKHDPTKMLIALINARYMYPNTPIEVRTTRKGFHIKICQQMDVQTDIQVRRLLGDDPERLFWSEKHIEWDMPEWMADVLFDSKERNGKRSYTKIIRPI